MIILTALQYKHYKVYTVNTGKDPQFRKLMYETFTLQKIVTKMANYITAIFYGNVFFINK